MEVWAHMGNQMVVGHVPRGQEEDNILQMGVLDVVVGDGRVQRGHSWDHRVLELADRIVQQGDSQGIRVELWVGSCMDQGERVGPGCEGKVHLVVWRVEREHLRVLAEEREQVMACWVVPRSWQVVGQELLS